MPKPEDLWDKYDTGEAQTIRWEQIDLERRFIRIRQGEVAAKNGVGRNPPISENLFAWLKDYAQRQGPVAPPQVKKYETACRAAFRRQEGLVAGSPEYKKWVNVLRHSYGSYRFPLLNDLTVLGQEMGNSPRVLCTHYIGAVDRSEEKAFWKIVPALMSKELSTPNRYRTVQHLSADSGPRTTHEESLPTRPEHER